MAMGKGCFHDISDNLFPKICSKIIEDLNMLYFLKSFLPATDARLAFFSAENFPLADKNHAK